MNKQEAIRILGETTLLSPIGQAAYVAISALEQQIPKQIEIKDFNLSKSYHCPICKFRFVSKVNGDLVGGMIKNYCPDCGQAIDWRNEDE